jgi:hypothetical protein
MKIPSLYLWILSIQLFCHFQIRPVVSIPHSSTTSIHYLKQIANLKSGRRCIWVYHGVLRNPLNGKEIASIHGLEINQPIQTTTSTNQTFIQTLQSYNPFHVPTNTSYLTKKIFFYTTNSSHSMEPLQFYKIRTNSPKRKVQPIKTMHQQVTLGYDESSNHSFVNIRWPSGRVLKNSKLSINKVPIGFPLSLFMQQYQLISFIKSKTKQAHHYWISFASEENSGRSQEFYLFKHARILPFLPLSTIDYKRYGECPPWFSTGRFCSTELSGKKYANMRDVPDRLIDMIEKYSPEFTTRKLTKESFALESDPLAEYKPWYRKIWPL